MNATVPAWAPRPSLRTTIGSLPNSVLRRQISFYAVSILSVAGAFTLGMLLDPNASTALGPMFLVAAIAVTSWHGGLWPGLLSVLGSTLAVYYCWVTPRYTFQIDATEWPWFITFVLSALVGMTLCVHRRQAEDQLKKARDELEMRVAERTRALETSMLEHQKAEEESRRAQEELARVMRLTAMGELAASIAHEINQPLAAIMSNAQAGLRWLAGEQPNLDEARAALQCIVRDGKRAANVTKTVRAMVTKSPPHMVPLDVNLAIREILMLVDREIRRRRAPVHTELAASLPLVLADRIQLQQVILNLIMNALDAMEGVAQDERRLLIRSAADEDGRITVAVQDSGEGIAPDDMERVFDAFFTTRPNGMGMGLAICRSIVESHGGRLWVMPAAQRGTTVGFSLPVASSITDAAA